MEADTLWAAITPGWAIVEGAVATSESLIDRDRIGGRDSADACRGHLCDLPVTTAEDLAAASGVPV
ncbi:hypothetical protein [Mycolicibacterium hodleri]|uniref:Uncharacterized protein n=1 Tax=Mycolicibacterium hodleri TaxID=49897 RepID=A0A502EHT6_9MYCO|nr:hypothetical protein [Mycolicibacterium hodleri]TPG35901.1 hypothetical protein EAH80_07680 [Mycolicibacterium hodleri]